MGLKILVVWVHVKDITPTDQQNVLQTLAQAGNLLSSKIGGFEVIGQTGVEDTAADTILPMGVGINEAQDTVDANTAQGMNVVKCRDMYLDASQLKEHPVYVLFIVPRITNANAYSIKGQYCSVLPIPGATKGSPDYHTYAHEIMHGLGLDHVNDKTNLMNPTRLVGGDLSGDMLEQEQLLVVKKFIQAHPSLVGQQ